MPVIAAAIVSKQGRVVLSRHFADVSRVRAEGLLSAFPKLAAAGGASSKQHAVIDSGSVRYVYQPLEQTLFLVCITGKGGNIVEDLATLRLLGRLVAEHASPVSEERIAECAFEILFSFDEAVSMGYRETASMEDLMASLEMQSAAEDRAKEEEEEKKKAAALVAKQKAKEFKAKRMTGESGGAYGGVGSGSGGGGYDDEEAVGGGIQASTVPTYAAVGQAVQQSSPEPQRAGFSAGGGISLQGKARKADFAAKVLGEAGAKPQAAPAQAAAAAPAAPTAEAIPGAGGCEPVYIRIEEKVSAGLTRDGGVSSVDVKGDLTVTVNDDAAAAVRLHLGACAGGAASESGSPGPEGVPFKTHPNVNKQLFTNDRVLAIKDGRPYPVRQPLAILRWRMQSLPSGLKLPLSVTCWPGDDSASIEFELENPQLQLRDVTLRLPLAGAQATSSEADCGNVSTDPASGSVVWHIPIVDAAQPSGTLEVSLDRPAPDAFFPAAITFAAPTTLAGVTITAAVSTETGAPVAFACDSAMLTDRYIVE